MKLPKIAILLATYNGEEWIDEQINSIFEQCDVEVHLFISDDQSNDDTINLIKKNNNVEKIFFLKRSEQKFNSGAKNFFYLIRNIKVLDYDYFGFSDQDDLWHKNKLISAVEALVDNECDFYSSSFYAFWKNKKKIYVNKNSNQKKYDYIFQSPGPGSTFLITKQKFIYLQNFINQSITNIENIISHDWFIYAYARKNNFKWTIDKTPYLNYRQHSDNEIGVNIGIKSYIKRINAIFKGNYSFQVYEIINSLKINNELTKLLKKPNFLNKIFLILNVFNCRRSIRDGFVMILFFFLLDEKKNNKKPTTLFK